MRDERPRNTPDLRSVDTVDTDALNARAVELAPQFAARANEFETARQLPADVSAQMAEAGFYRMFVPEHFGGSETSPVVAAQVFEALARGDAACGWVAFIGATTGGTLARIDNDTGKRIFATPRTMITGAFAATGRAEKVTGGFIVNGRWQWGSGSYNADWIGGGCTILVDGKPLTNSAGMARNHMLLFEKNDVHMLDTWHVSGLRGTGSTDYEVRDLFVPEGQASGFRVRDMPPGPLYRFPQFTLLATGIGAVALGVARGAIDELVALAVAKKRVGSTSSIAERGHTQMEVAQAEATLRSARAFFYNEMAKVWVMSVAGQEASVADRRDLRLATTHAVQAAVRVVDAMYTLAGGSSVYETSRLQRQFRDIHVATQHIMVGTGTLETVGRLYLGLETMTAGL